MDRWPTVEAFAVALDDVRARARDIPAPVRAWVRDVLAAGGDISMGLVGVGTTFGVLSLIGAMQTGSGIGRALDNFFVGMAMISMASLFGGIALVRLGTTVMSTRDLVRAGHGHAEAASAIAQEEAERMAEQAAVPAAERRRRALTYLLTGSFKTALAAWIATFDHPDWLTFPAAALAVLLALITVRTVASALRRGPTLWSKLLRGRLGRLLFRVSGVFNGGKGAPELSPALPTLVALGGETDALFRALPAPARQQLHDLPRILASLRDEAERLRLREDDVAGERLATVAAAMESVRLELLSLEAGLASIPDVTRHLEASRRVAERVDAALRLPGEPSPGSALGGEPTPA